MYQLDKCFMFVNSSAFHNNLWGTYYEPRMTEIIKQLIWSHTSHFLRYPSLCDLTTGCVISRCDQRDSVLSTLNFHLRGMLNFANERCSNNEQIGSFKMKEKLEDSSFPLFIGIASNTLKLMSEPWMVYSLNTHTHTFLYLYAFQ